ncbi:DUF1173 domain-containing protein [Gluconacetobacter dulcium]|uniref:DUF1173 domain-containing protein n=1 Tax=Gluconacetobacter dulcium TaxID=2729096 RepID=UPI002180BC30|nr:DUF1173 domain-containing protein [Gluconacetobacter dulcium]
MSDWITFPDGHRGRLRWACDAERAVMWQRMLARAHGDLRRPVCDCVAGGRRLELAVRELTRRDGGRQVRRYCLARMPHDGTRHQAGCPFHETDARRSGRSGYEEGVIRELPDGRLKIAISGGLEVRQPAPEPVAAPGGEQPNGAARRRQASMSLLGLLHLLWENGGLNVWSPEDRRRRTWWPTVRGSLDHAAAGIVVGREALSDVFATVGYRDVDGPRLLAEVARRCGQSRRVILVGVVNQITRYQPPGADGTPPRPPRLRVVFDGVRNYGLYVSAPIEAERRLARSFPWAWRVLGQEPRDRAIRVAAVVAARVQPMRNGAGFTAWADGIALMETAPSLVPVASFHELRVLQALQAEERRFRKPLRYDAERQAVHPDFELLDTGNPRGTPMEVFGRVDETYVARAAEKQRYYNAVYGTRGWWAWDATQGHQWPAFPPIAQSPARSAK